VTVYTPPAYVKCSKCGWVHFKISAVDAQNAGGISRHLRCQRCGADSTGLLPATGSDVPRLAQVRGIVERENGDKK
jgi:hypothetical protein